MSEQQPSGDPFGRFMGLLLMGAAVLWMAFCGLCAFGVLTTVFTEAGATNGALSSILIVLLITGLGAAGGYAVFIAGRSLWRS
jgi:hypothetical protein